MTRGGGAGDDGMEVDEDTPPPPPPSPPSDRLSIGQTSDQVLRTCQERLGHQHGKISTTVYTPNETTKGFSLLPNVRAEALAEAAAKNGSDGKETVLEPAELLPPTPSVFLNDKEQAFSPQLLEFCLQKPIVLIRNLSNVCEIDLPPLSPRRD
jgi:hypothetical protein